MKKYKGKLAYFCQYNIISTLRRLLTTMLYIGIFNTWKLRPKCLRQHVKWLIIKP